VRRRSFLRDDDNTKQYSKKGTGVNVYLVVIRMIGESVEEMWVGDLKMQCLHLENRKARAHTRSRVQDDLASVLDD